jgi:hypothetical protein
MTECTSKLMLQGQGQKKEEDYYLKQKTGYQRTGFVIVVQ